MLWISILPEEPKNKITKGASNNQIKVNKCLLFYPGASLRTQSGAEFQTLCFTYSIVVIESLSFLEQEFVSSHFLSAYYNKWSFYQSIHCIYCNVSVNILKSGIWQKSI